MKPVKKLWIGAFLLIQAILYVLILTTGGQMLVLSSFGAIVLCFLFSLCAAGDRLIKLGMCFTVFADFCLVICRPVEQLWGMIFFLVTQSSYAGRLHKMKKSTGMLVARLGLIAAIEAVALLVLRDKTDALALVSVCYYALLATNIIHSFVAKDILFGVALCLFILCDTVVGLQVAAGGYLQLAPWLERLLFMDFNLSWFFYLPSQVLIALRSKKV